jgi:hypothetical protein
VSFDAARRAVSEAKAHAKAKAAALLQASSASWADKLHAAKADRAALQVQLEQLQQEHQQLQQQVRQVYMPGQGQNDVICLLVQVAAGCLRTTGVEYSAGGRQQLLCALVGLMHVSRMLTTHVAVSTQRLLLLSLLVVVGFC